MNSELRQKLIEAIHRESKRIRTPEEATETLKKIGILAPNGDLSPNYYYCPEGCLMVWNLNKEER